MLAASTGDAANHALRTCTHAISTLPLDALEAGLAYESVGNTSEFIGSAELRAVHPLGKLSVAIIDAAPTWLVDTASSRIEPTTHDVGFGLGHPGLVRELRPSGNGVRHLVRTLPKPRLAQAEHPPHA